MDDENEICPRCDGTGEPWEGVCCGYCGGSGEVRAGNHDDDEDDDYDEEGHYP